MCGGYLLNKSVYLLNYVDTLIKESVYLVGKGVHLLYRASVAGAKFNKLSHFLQSFGTNGTPYQLARICRCTPSEDQPVERHGYFIPALACREAWLFHSSLGLQRGMVISFQPWPAERHGYFTPALACREAWLFHSSLGLQRCMIISFQPWPLRKGNHCL